MTESVSKWVNDWIPEWMNEWMNETKAWVNKWMATDVCVVSIVVCSSQWKLFRFQCVNVHDILWKWVKNTSNKNNKQQQKVPMTVAAVMTTWYKIQNARERKLKEGYLSVLLK